MEHAALTTSIVDDLRDVVAELACTRGVASPVTIDVRNNVYQSRRPSWLVTVRTPDADALELFVKAGPGDARNAVGDSCGIDYETRVYQEALTPWRVAAPEFYGTLRGAQTDWSYLVIESLESYIRVPKAPHPESIMSAARWLGESQRSCGAARRPTRPGLYLYGAETFRKWMDRAAEYHADFTGVVAAVLRAERKVDLFEILATADATLVHGDFYPENVLLHHDDIRVVDWEWAGLGAGEIDIAALTDWWDDEIIKACTEAYAAARWPGRPPYDVERMVRIARLYLDVRWLGGRPDRVDNPDTPGYLEKFQETAASLGLL